MNKEKQKIISDICPFYKKYGSCERCKTTLDIGDEPCYFECMANVIIASGYRKQSEGENISQMHPSDEFICEKCGLIIRECCRYEIDEDDGDEIRYEFPYRFCPRCGMKVKGGVE